jgi:ubiquinone/menaquinone biosynthesis C-methylase UbiE
VDQGELRPGHHVLEVGCGTGALLMDIANGQRGAILTGIDPDPKALDLARRKATSASVSMQLDRGFSDALPYPNASFDRVFSCFMLHHLETAEEKRITLREIRRVLKPGGRLHLLDFVRASGKRFDLVGWLHSSHQLRDNSDDRLLSFIEEAGLTNAAVVRHATMALVLRLAYFQGTAPAAGASASQITFS